MKAKKAVNDNITEQIAKNYSAVLERAAEAARAAGRRPDEISVVAVSKTHSAETIAAAYSAGIRTFGENYAREFKEKAPKTAELLGFSPEWHFIGHLQTNKCKYVTPYCSFIHSLDSIGLAGELSKFAGRLNKELTVLLQVNTSGETSKSGCAPDDAPALAESVAKLPGLRAAGLMTIAGLIGSPAETRREFELLRRCREKLSAAIGVPESRLELSMGMSGDFEEAIAEGATIIRIGSLIFGERLGKE